MWNADRVSQLTDMSPTKVLVALEVLTKAGDIEKSTKFEVGGPYWRRKWK